MNFGIITNNIKDPEGKFLHILLEAIEKNNNNVAFFYDVKDLNKIMISVDNFDCDFVFVLGGDGTILTTASFFAKFNIRIIPVNLGRLGYLSEINIFEISSVLSLLEDGSFFIDRRVMLNCCSCDEKFNLCALNDIVFSHQNVSRLTQFEVGINNCFIDNYKCDGIIISTPTGSTAYSLSAGGPVIAPYTECFVITPICPHSLRSKVIVVSDNDIISVKSVSDVETVCSFDGHNKFTLKPYVTYNVQKYDSFAEFVRFKKSNFFEILKNKLND